MVDYAAAIAVYSDIYHRIIDNRNSDCYGGNQNDNHPCDTQFIFCLRPLNTTGRDCSYSEQVTLGTDWQGRDLPIDFTQVPTPLGLDNPLSLPGLSDTYTVSNFTHKSLLL